MSILIVADVHANLAAFEAVIADATARAGAPLAIWSLGDVVGYGPQPRECIALLRRYPHLSVAGNHDLAATEVLGTQNFNPYAAAAAEWTASVLGDEERRFLRDAPLVVEEGDFTIVHGSLTDPVWDYLLRVQDAGAHLARQQTPYALVGHSHLPLDFYDGGGRDVAQGESLPLDGRRFVANPGGLGQPRDGDPRAPYALLDRDAGRLSFHRVAYDIAATQALMREAGLPAPLIDRLSRGR